MEITSIADALKNGVSEDELRTAFEDSLRKAKEQHMQMLRKKEQERLNVARMARMNKARAQMIDAILEYLITGGIEFEDSASKNDFGCFLYELIKESEEELIFNKMKATKDKDNLKEKSAKKEDRMSDEFANAILDDFLKRLH